MALSTYTKTAWINDDVPDIDAPALNKIENQLYDLTEVARGGFLPGEFKDVAFDVVAGSEPLGWLACDGRSLLVADYPDLSNAIRSTYGGVDASHFNLPNANGRGRVAKGIASGGTINRVLGTPVGEETHTLTMAEMPAHSHRSDGLGGSGGATVAAQPSLAMNPVAAHSHGDASGGLFMSSGGTNFATLGAPGGFQMRSQSVTAAAGAHTPSGSVGNHAHTVNVNGGGAAHTQMQPSLVVSTIIKT